MKYKYITNRDGYWELLSEPNEPSLYRFTKKQLNMYDRTIPFVDIKDNIEKIKRQNPSLKDEDFIISNDCESICIDYNVEEVKSEGEYKKCLTHYLEELQIYNKEKELLPKLIEESLKEKEKQVLKLEEMLKQFKGVT